MISDPEIKAYLDEVGEITRETWEDIKCSPYNDQIVIETTCYSQGYTIADYGKPTKRSMKKSKDNTGRLIELHPTKGWRRVRKEK